jgi:hypothetical protein
MSTRRYRRRAGVKVNISAAPRAKEDFSIGTELRSVVKSYFAPVRAVIREIKSGSEHHNRPRVFENS